MVPGRNNRTHRVTGIDRRQVLSLLRYLPNKQTNKQTNKQLNKQRNKETKKQT